MKLSKPCTLKHVSKYVIQKLFGSYLNGQCYLYKIVLCLQFTTYYKQSSRIMLKNEK